MKASRVPQEEEDRDVGSQAFDTKDSWRQSAPSYIGVSSYNGVSQQVIDGGLITSACYYLTSNWKILFLGQVLSFLLASAGAAQATLHLDCGLSSPTFTMSLIYLVLGVFHLWKLIWRKAREEGQDTRQCQYTCFGLIQLQRPVWQYLIMAILDVEANAVTMLSFRYTTLTSVTLFDALAIPSAMIISRFFLGRKYTWIHLFGVVMCMAGVVFNVLQDYKESGGVSSTDDTQNGSYPHRLFGDFLAITGGVLYGVNDVLTEATVRHNDGTTEYLAMMGAFAFIISLAQALILEWEDILEFLGENDNHSSTCSLGKGWFLFFAFVGVTLMSYKGASMFLMMSEAAFFNLSLLTGDLWSILFSIVAERIIPHSLFFVALVFVISGVVIYEMAPSPVLEDNNGFHEQLAQIHSDFDMPTQDEGMHFELT